MDVQKRRSQRIPCRLAVAWMRRGKPVPAYASDINAHGVFIVTSLAAEVGELLQVVVELPSGPLHACVVARFVGTSVGGRGIGAELFVVRDVDRDRWAAHYKRVQQDVIASAVALDAYDFEEIRAP